MAKKRSSLKRVNTQLGKILRKDFEFTTIKAEHELIKKILRERLKVEI